MAWQPLNTCRSLRLASAAIIGNALTANPKQSETDVLQKIKQGFLDVPNLFEKGWYTPPPDGISVLFGSPSDNYERTRFDSLRTQTYWPDSHSIEGDESVGILYVSPISTSGIIGDWGGTYYLGTNEKIRQHIRSCLETVEQLAEFAEVGKQFSDISHYADTLLKERRLTTNRTRLTSRLEATGTNCGHTLPWTSSSPTTEQTAILESRNQTAINKLISDQRIFINANEQTPIPETIAYTVELRLESLDDPLLPNTFFHTITCFDNGKKTIVSDYNSFFKKVGMEYITSKF